MVEQLSFDPLLFNARSARRLRDSLAGAREGRVAAGGTHCDRGEIDVEITFMWLRFLCSEVLVFEPLEGAKIASSISLKDVESDCGRTSLDRSVRAAEIAFGVDTRPL